MTSKERVIKAVNHKTPDRTPCGYVSTSEVDEMLKKHFKTDSMDVVLEKLGVDIRVINAAYQGPKLRTWDDGRFENLWGQVRKPVKNIAGTYLEAAELPYADFTSVSDVEKFRWPKVDWFDYSVLADLIKKYKDYAIVFWGPNNMDLINGTAFGRGVERVMYDIALEDPVGMACMEKRFESCYAISQKALETAKGAIDIMWIGDDYGSQNGLLVSPKTWRKLFYPKVEAMCKLGHKHGAKVMLHSCGSTVAIWPDLIEAGVDIYDTVQPEAVDMNPVELKKKFGSKMCFHGTISTQQTLPFGTVDEVRREIRQRINEVGVDGGLIIAPAHNFQPDTPVENILAMYDEITK